MVFIFGNYGNNTIAALQWAFEEALDDVFMLDVDTGWAAERWFDRVQKGKALAASFGFTAITLRPPQSFERQIIDRGQFPSVKFQWCATFLKGQAFTQWADEIDPACQATVIMGSRRADSRARFDLPEFDDDNEYFGARRVWYPLYASDDQQRNTLIKRAGFEVLDHRSLECLPCVHNSPNDHNHMSSADHERVSQVSKRINIPIIAEPTASNNLENFDMGCGSRYGCGE